MIDLTERISLESGVAPGTLAASSLACQEGKEVLKSGKVVTPGQIASSGVPSNLSDRQRSVQGKGNQPFNIISPENSKDFINF